MHMLIRLAQSTCLESCFDDAHADLTVQSICSIMVFHLPTHTHVGMLGLWCMTKSFEGLLRTSDDAVPSRQSSICTQAAQTSLHGAFRLLRFCYFRRKWHLHLLACKTSDINPNCRKTLIQGSSVQGLVKSSRTSTGSITFTHFTNVDSAVKVWVGAHHTFESQSWTVYNNYRGALPCSFQKLVPLFPYRTPLAKNTAPTTMIYAKNMTMICTRPGVTLGFVVALWGLLFQLYVGKRPPYKPPYKVPFFSS